MTWSIKWQLLPLTAPQRIVPWTILSLLFGYLLLIFAKTKNEKYSGDAFHHYAVQLTS
jgi:hypothetical protein